MNKFYFLLYDTGDKTDDVDVALEWVEDGFLVRIIDPFRHMAVGELIPIV